ncbi:MAG: hypothetical protein EXX96DRAFT_653783 [Benjaminiella poitrasii]|nr:MAG: hypothetical protein EXX96DRAFT_653783 [Benjaminiella poitrasii]
MKVDKEKIVDELGNDAIDWDDTVTPFHLTTLTRIRQYCEMQEVGQEPNVKFDAKMEEMSETVKQQIKKSYYKYSNEQKLLFVYMNRVKLFNAAKSGRLASGIAERTTQKWAKRLKEDKDWNILEKQTNLINRPKLQLRQEHKTHLINFYDDNPQAVTLRPVARNDTTKIAARLD